ncbi:ribosome-binding factor A, partial [Treponema pallidum]
MKQVSQLRVRKLGEHIRAEIAQLIMLGKIKDPRVSPFL